MNSTSGCPLGKCQDADCDRKSFCLVEMRSQSSRSASVNKAIASQDKQDMSREFTGTYVGFDSKSGQDLIKLPSGGIIRATSVSNGIAKPQAPISGIIPLGSIMAFVDRMPR
jgi:hypothetical protein